MKLAVRPFFRLLAVVWLALGMTLPVSAQMVHYGVHLAAQIDLDEHHHHGDDGAISVHEHDDNEVPDGGHDHMPALSLNAVALPDTEIGIAAPIIERAAFTIPRSRSGKQRASEGLRRPPRRS